MNETLHPSGEVGPSMESARQAIERVMSEFPNAKVSDKGVELASLLLCHIQEAYDDKDSEHYTPYHNGQHSLNVLRRSWQLWQLLGEKLPKKFLQEDFELLLLGSVGHDLVWNQGAEEGEDETTSGHIVATLMLEKKYTFKEAERVSSAIIATSVQRDEKSSIVQSRLRQGAKDPLKLILATADVNGIAMEGAITMLNDAFNLYRESTETPFKSALFKPQNLVSFLAYQSQFLGDRWEARDGDIAYYFNKREAAIVKEAYDEAFSTKANEARKMAAKLRNHTVADRAIRMTFGSASWFVSQTSDNLERLKSELSRLLSK